MYSREMRKSKEKIHAAQRTKFVEKVHKPPLRIYVINFELDGFNASMPVLQTPKSCDAVIEIFKFIRYVEETQ